MYPIFKYNRRYLPGMALSQIRAIPDRRRSAVIVATGAIEQHGPQLPVATDSYLGQVWLTGIFERLPGNVPAYVGPPIIVGKSNEHVGFPGTLIHSRGLLEGHLWTIARQLHLWDFGSMLVLNTHGGNSSVLRYAMREIARKLGIRCEFLGSGYSPDVSVQEATYGFHANEVETALLLATAPQTCHPEASPCHFPARIEDPGLLRPENAPATYAWASQDISPHGVMGDATKGTLENGERWRDGIVDGYVKHLTAHCASL